MKRILIVDDDPSIVSIFEFILQQVGYDAVSAKSADECIEKVRQSSKFDLIFLDVKLNKIRGLDVYEKIKQFHPKTSVIMMTDYMVDDLLEHAFDKGIFGIIYKPFDVEEVLDILDKIFNTQILV